MLLFGQKNIRLLIITTLSFLFVVFFEIYNPLSYLLLFSLMAWTIYRLNGKVLLCANVLFLVFFGYTACLGPFFLMLEDFELNYDCFSILLGGLLAFTWGNATNENEIPSPIMDKGRVEFEFPRVEALKILYAISALAACYFFYKNRSLLAGDLNGNRIEAQSGMGAILYISQLPILIVPMIYDLYDWGRKHGRSLITGVEMLFYIGLSSVLLLLSGFRAPVLTMYICLAILYIHKNRISSKKILLVGVVFIVIIETMGMMRSSMSGEETNETFLLSLGKSLIVNDLNLSYIFRVFPENTPFQYGYTYLLNLIMLKPGPDLDFTMWLKETLNIEFSGGGVTPTIVGEFYINFGTVGIYVGMFLLGMLGNYINRYFLYHSTTFLGAFYVWQFAHCASGGLANVMILVILYTILYWIIIRFPMEYTVESKG